MRKPWPGILLACLIGWSSGCITVPAQSVYRIDNRIAPTSPRFALPDPPPYPRDGRRYVYKSIQFSPDGKRLLTTDPPTIWTIEATGTQPLRLTGHVGDVRFAAWSHDGRLVATSTPDPYSNSADNTIRLWNAETGGPVRVIESEEPYQPARVAFSPDDSLLCWASTMRKGHSEEGFINVLSLKTGQRTSAPLPPGTSSYWFKSIGITSDNQYIYAADRRWRLAQSPSLELVEDRKYPMYLMAYSPDLQRGYAVAPLYRYDVPSNLNSELNRVAMIMAHGMLLEASLAAVTIPLRLFEPTYMEYSGHDVALYEIDLHDGTVVARREFAQARAHREGDLDTAIETDAVAVSSSGRHIALATRSGIHVIDFEMNKVVARLTCESKSKSLHTVCFSPDGKQIAGSSVDAHVWEMP